jgi:branched-chain amino acid aminotransferase
MKIFLNGHIIAEEEAKVSVFDHGLLYGDGVFEGIRAYDGYVFKLDQHIDRLYASAHAIMLDIPMKKAEMAEAILQTLRANELQSSYIRPVVTRGVGDLGIDPRKCKSGPTIFVITKPMRSLFPEEVLKQGLKAVVASTRNKAMDSCPPNVKSLNYLANIMAKIEANLVGADEAIMLDQNGYVAEGSADNIFYVKDGRLVTPPTITALPGITRDTVIELARKDGMDVYEENFGIANLFMAQECFITGTAAEIAPVVEISGRKIGNGKPGLITSRLQDLFKSITGIPETGTAIYEPVARK